MRWQGRRQSSNVEDRRRMSGGKMVAGGGIVTIIVVIIVMLLGGDPQQVLDTMQTETTGQSDYQPTAQEEQLAEFVGVVLADTEDVWDSIFRSSGNTYRQPKLVLFRDAIQSACGFAGAATGPFYCSEDEKIYIDLGFLDQLQQKLGAQGDFAVAYIIAHEVGHHVQKLTGVLDEVHGMRDRVSDAEFNQLTVRLELQADFLSGLWAHHAQRMKNILEEGDLEEAFNAAAAVGDDRIQMKTQGYIVPDSFTHGTSEQRMRWFRQGWTTGDLSQGDTFSEEYL